MVLEIADYEAKPVFDQIRLTQHLRQVLSDTTAHTATDDVVSIVREQGAVLSFLADPEECFTTALAIREAMLNHQCYRDLLLRIGINLGSIELARDEFGHAYVSGAGRRDAERVMRQGPPRQISVTRPFFEVLSRAAPELAGTLEYQGIFSDTLGPALGVYRLSVPAGAEAHGPAGARQPIADLLSQPAPLLSPANPGRSRSAAQPATSEARGRRPQLRYVLVPLLLGVAVLASSSRLRVEVAAWMPVPQLAVAVTETSMPRVGMQDSGVSPSPSDGVASVQPLASGLPDAAAEKPARRALRLARRGPDPAPASSRAVRPELSREQERTIEATAEAQPASVSDSATLVLAVKPWGEVYVDGTKVGVTPPLKRFQVAPGLRVITIKNSALPEYRVRLNVTREAQVTIAHDFSCGSERERRCWEEISKGLAPQSAFKFKTVEADPQTEVR
ncbi:MAG TPA: hypothetical protein VML56_03905 [Burkholderiales bacterium]|nr:hypothetical protein [Burkholderiales bacterium]